MPRLTRAAALPLVPLLLLGCQGTDRPLAPAAPGVERSVTASDARMVNLMDACDGPTFNAAVGPGTCARPHGVRFDEFVAQLQQHQSAGAWHNAPPNLTMFASQLLAGVNKGGEVHTFTRVAAFGGGVVPFLNQLSGNPVPAPECLAAGPGEFLPPGGVDVENVGPPGTALYQCCIHPWMRTVVHVQ